MSRWRMPRVWAWSNASAAWMPSWATVRIYARLWLEEPEEGPPSGRGVAALGPGLGAGIAGSDSSRGSPWEAVASRPVDRPVPLASRPPDRLAAKVEVEISARFAA